MNLIEKLNLIASSRESDLNDDGHIIAEAAKRIEDLEAALPEALGTIWELHPWDSRENYERDPTVKHLMSLLPTSDKP